jgi:hypothetical protein
MACDSISVARILTLPFRDRRVLLEIAEGVTGRAQQHINAALDAYPHCSSAVQEVVKANMDELLLVIANLIYDAVGVKQLVRLSDSQLLRDSSQKTPPSRATQPPAPALSLSGDRIKLLLGWISDDFIDMDIRNVSPETISYLHDTQLSDVRGLVRKCMELTAMYASQIGADTCLISHAQTQCEKATLWCNQLIARFKEVQTHWKCNVLTSYVDDLASSSRSNRKQYPGGSGETPRPYATTIDPSAGLHDLSGTAKDILIPTNQTGQRTDADQHSSTETGRPPLDGFLTKSNISRSADASDPVDWCEPLRLQLNSQFRALDPLVWAGHIPDTDQSRVAHTELLPCAGVDPHLPRTMQHDNSHRLEGNSLAVGLRTVFEHHYAPAVLPPLQDRGTPTRWVWKPGILSHSHQQASIFSTPFHHDLFLANVGCERGTSHLHVD